MRLTCIRYLFPLICVIFSFSSTHSQPTENEPETEIPRLLAEADSLRYLAPDTALTYLELALSLTESGELDSLKAETEYSLARAYMSKGYYNSALESGFSALRYYDSIGDFSSMGRVKHRIATIYLETENTELSRQYDTEALALLDPATDSLDMAWTYLGLGNYMDYTQNQDSAFYYYFLAMEIAEALKDDYASFSCYNNIALLHKDEEEFETALTYFLKGVEITKKNNDYSSLAFILNNIGAMYFEWGKLPEALEYSEQAYGMALENQSASGLVNIHSNLAETYEATGNWKKAFIHQKEYTTLIKTYFNEKIRSSMADMEGKYQNEQKQAEIALLSKENEFKALKIDRQKITEKFMIAGLILLVLFVIFGIWAYLDKQKTNRLLEVQQTEIQRINADLEVKVQERTIALANANAELNDLLYRTSHDLRSPITNIQGLVELARTEAMPANTVLEHIDGTMKILDQQNLSICEIGFIRQHAPAPETTDVSLAVKRIMEELNGQIGSTATQIELDIDTDTHLNLDPFLFDIVVKEVVANAFAFGAPHIAPIRISARKQGNGLKLLIKDQGPGIPKEIKSSLFDLFVKGTISPGHFGLGLYKARLAAELMGGGIDFRSDEGQGAVFVIELAA